MLGAEFGALTQHLPCCKRCSRQPTVDCAFTREKQFLLGLADSPGCLPSCASVEDVEHGLWKCTSYTDVPREVVCGVKGAGNAFPSRENLLFFVVDPDNHLVSSSQPS